MLSHIAVSANSQDVHKLEKNPFNLSSIHKDQARHCLQKQRSRIWNRLKGMKILMVLIGKCLKSNLMQEIWQHLKIIALHRIDSCCYN